MKLHKDKKEFTDAITTLADRLNTAPAIIEKDYYVTMFLQDLNKRVPDLLFKGGTSLSKCYKIINRFSEDIDLTLDAENQTQSKKRTLNHAVIDVCKELGFEILNEADIFSRRDFNKYEIAYPVIFPSSALRQHLLVETVFMVKAYPGEYKPAASMIYDFWKELGDKEAIEQYEMLPFQIRVQTLERTLIDKVFALCNHYLSNDTTGLSRHIYDLSRLLTVVQLNDELKRFAKEVRYARKEHSNYFIEQQSGYDIQVLLREIIDKEVYRKDYEAITQRVLFDGTTYDEAITALEKIIESGVFASDSGKRNDVDI